MSAPEPQAAISILPETLSADGIPPWPTTIPAERAGLGKLEIGTQVGPPLAASSTARTKAPTSGSVDLNVRFSFGIPRGETGMQGGPGMMGEVSNAQMNSAISSAIAGTSDNTDAVALLNLTVSDPPTQGEMQAIASKLDELIAALRR